MHKNSGFTLAELIIALAILAIIAAVSLPVFGNLLEQSKIKVDTASAASVQTALDVYSAESGSYPAATDFDGLVTALHEAGYLRDAQVTPQSDGSFSYDSAKHIVTYSRPANPQP